MSDTTNPDAPMNAVAIRSDLTHEQVDLVKRTICRDSTDDELSLFVQQCNRTGLDPFSRQIHAVKRWNSKSKREEMQIQVGIDGFRLVAQRTKETDGQDGPFWCGTDGEWLKDDKGMPKPWLSEKPPAAAMVVVYRKGESRPYIGIARYSTYVQTTREGNPNSFWAKMPDVMIAKCAEALALRKAFPQELSGLYTPEELQHDQQVEVAQPQSNTPHTPAITSGKPDHDSLYTHLCKTVDDIATRGNRTGQQVATWLIKTMKERWPKTPDRLADLPEAGLNQAIKIAEKKLSELSDTQPEPDESEPPAHPPTPSEKDLPTQTVLADGTVIPF
jgi:phage recombination protein Bet